MHDEIFDVVDASGAVIGTASWDELHENGLLHVTAAVILFKDSSKQEVLLQRRSMSVKQMPGLLQHAAGGHVVSGKTPDEGVRMELQEELFHEQELPEIELRKVTHFHQHDIPGNCEILHIYEGFYDGPFSPSPHELSGEPFWVDWEQLLLDIKEHPEKYTASFLMVLEEYLRSLAKLDA